MRRGADKKQRSDPDSQAGTVPSAEAVAEYAYARFLARGQEHGADLDDWLAAERELRSRAPDGEREERAGGEGNEGSAAADEAKR
jgi:hypothetical protein